MKSQLELFEAVARPANAPMNRRPRPKPTLPALLSDDEMARHLEATGNYRILRRLLPRPVVSEPRPGFPHVGVLIDTETTGLNRRTAEVIEIGAIAFTYDEDGNFGDVIGLYGGLQQPSQPIPSEIVTLTGITDEMVAGQTFDLRALNALVAPADLVIAHNAGFDRYFCETIETSFIQKPWACSVAEIDWKRRGFEGTKLGYLIGQSGYFHEGHRAVDDCFALLEILMARQDDTPFAELMRASKACSARVWAENSPFDMKEKLKARGYRWSDGTDGRAKAWWCDVAEHLLEAELTFLRTEIYYRADADPPVQYLTAETRYRS